MSLPSLLSKQDLKRCLILASFSGNMRFTHFMASQHPCRLLLVQHAFFPQPAGPMAGPQTKLGPTEFLHFLRPILLFKNDLLLLLNV